MAIKLGHLFPLIIFFFVLAYFSCCHSHYLEGFDFLASYINNFTRKVKIINVDQFGARGDGKTDDTKAFKSAWLRTCSSSGSVLQVSKNKNYLLKPIAFSGPCKSTTTVQIYGTITASGNRSDYDKAEGKWLLFDSVQNLLVQGIGTIDGNGKTWWENSCKVNRTLPCKDAPTALTFQNCSNLEVKNLKIQDAQQMHVVFKSCTYVTASGITISAPRTSPNTDGIHVTGTQNAVITSSTIGTGDDCISIVSGSKNVKAMGITCGPGHGISIGSLGADDSRAYVSDVMVDGAMLYGTTNGVRIKTWQGGSGTASNIKFQNVKMYNVTNPIIIDQNYCDMQKPCKQQASAVQIKNITYEGISGTSHSQNAVVFNCSRSFPCKDITMQNVNLMTEDGETSKAVCNNVAVSNIGQVSPRCSGGA